MQKIKFDIYGQIQRGENVGWYVKFVDDTKETGGFYILLDSDIYDPNAEGYDSWLETFEDVNGYCDESNWVINWDIKTD